MSSCDNCLYCGSPEMLIEQHCLKEGSHYTTRIIQISATVDDVFSITLEDEDNGDKSSWKMTMHRDDAEKVARKFAEMLGIIPIKEKKK